MDASAGLEHSQLARALLRGLAAADPIRAGEEPEPAVSRSIQARMGSTQALLTRVDALLSGVMLQWGRHDSQPATATPGTLDHMRSAHRMAAFITGITADALGGDPPNLVHPVRAVGLAARTFEDAARRRWAPRTAGTVGAIAIPVAAALMATLAERSARRRPFERVGKAAGALALASAQRTLMQRALEVAEALDADDLDEARRLLSYHLVSRPTGDLDGGEIAGAVIESVAENLGDGVAGPWLAFAVAGSGGAWAYRALNTLDSLWGYRDSRYLDFGRAAAKLDDFVNLVPARAAALSICLASRRRARTRAFAVWRRDARLTESPNAGHPMAAMAGALGVELVKRDHYVLGAGGHVPAASDIRDAVDLARASCVVLAGMCLVVIFLRGGR